MRVFIVTVPDDENQILDVFSEEAPAQARKSEHDKQSARWAPPICAEQGSRADTRRSRWSPDLPPDWFPIYNHASVSEWEYT